MGLVIEEADWMNYFWDDDQNPSWEQLLNSPLYNDNYEHAVRGKIEIFTKIHFRDICCQTST